MLAIKEHRGRKKIEDLFSVLISSQEARIKQIGLDLKCRFITHFDFADDVIVFELYNNVLEGVYPFILKKTRLKINLGEKTIYGFPFPGLL